MDGTMETQITRELVGEWLTAWTVSGDGARVRLGFADGEGRPCRIDLPTVVASALLLTLPRILQSALDARGGGGGRVVHPLGAWRVEQAKERDRLIVTLSTPDGFSVAFVVAPDELAALGQAAGPRPPSQVLN